jgi:hypothetical protein
MTIIRLQINQRELRVTTIPFNMPGNKHKISDRNLNTRITDEENKTQVCNSELTTQKLLEKKKIQKKENYYICNRALWHCLKQHHYFLTICDFIHERNIVCRSKKQT